MKNIVKIKRALISISDKSFLKNLLSILSKYKIEIISSGKTYKKIKKFGFKSIEISSFTGSNEMLGGRVKTLHPKIHAGILNIRNNKNHRLDLIKNNFKEIDLVIVNFYPIENFIKKNNLKINMGKTDSMITNKFDKKTVKKIRKSKKNSFMSIFKSIVLNNLKN